jgi:glycosidase
LDGSQTAAQIAEILQELYGGQVAESILDDFTALLDRRVEKKWTTRGSTGKPTERDVILITYPDQVRAEGFSPLSALADFCERHLQGLVRHLHILPFYPSSSDDGFAVTDYRDVDPALGSWEDILRLNMHFGLMMDAVLNHASAQSSWFQAFLRGENPYRNFFIERQDFSGLEQVVRPRTSPLLHHYGKAPGEKTVWTTFSEDQVDLNYHNPRVLLEVADLLLFYASRGASIIRLDAVAFLWKEPGTSCISLPQTHRIVQLLHAVLDSAAPGVLLATETNVPHAENVSYAGNGGNEAHLIYNFALPPLVLHAFLSGDSHTLTRWVGALSPLGRETAFLNFLASHDGIGLNAAREILSEGELQKIIRTTMDRGGYVSLKRTPDGATLPYELNINYFDALSDPFGDEPLERQIRRFLCAHAILLSLAGVPAIYFHSMFGSRGWRDGFQQTGRKRSINRQKTDRDALERDLADETGIRRRVFSGLSGLIRARMRSPAFDPYGTQRTVDVGDSVFALLRTHSATGERVLCLQEVSGKERSLALDAGSIFGPLPPDCTMSDLISGRRFSICRDSLISLEPYQALWLSLSERIGTPVKKRTDRA